MIRVFVFLIVLAAAAFGVSWLLDRPGEVTVLWLGNRYEMSVFVAIGRIALACVVFTLAWSLFALVFRVPTLVSLARRARKHARGRDAVSRGMIAVGAGDLRAAQRASRDATRTLPHEPMNLLLRAQVAQMEGDRGAAEAAFAEMAAKDSTRLLGLRGLHVEAHRRGDDEAAYRFAQEAHRATPLPWAGDAIVTHHSRTGAWDDALAVVDANARGKIVDKRTAARQRAVLRTAIAQEIEYIDAEGALKAARSAVKRAPDLVPAAVLAARLTSRRGDFRSASKIVERAWDEAPHPELAAAYLAIRPGDSNADRFARATALARRKPDHPESRMLVAEAALATRDFARAREAMAPLMSDVARPTTRMCLLMADIEEAEHGESGALREWLSRASRAQRDPAWIADGVIATRWAPASPVTGRLDAFQWQTPREELGMAAREPIDAPVTIEPVLVQTLTTELPAEDFGDVGAAQDNPPVAPLIAPLQATALVEEKAPAPADPQGPEPKTSEPVEAGNGVAQIPPPSSNEPGINAEAPPAPNRATRPVVFPLATSPDDPGPRPRGAPYSGGFHS